MKLCLAERPFHGVMSDGDKCMVEKLLEKLHFGIIDSFLRTDLALSVGTVFVSSLFIYLVLKRLSSFVQSQVKVAWLLKLGREWQRLLPFMVSFFTLLHLCEVVASALDKSAPPVRIIQLRTIALLGVLVWLVMRAKDLFGEYYLVRIRNQKRPVIDHTAFFALNKLASIFVLVPAALIGLQILGVPLDALLTFGGIGGLAVSWAAKDVIANFFGGLMIYIHRPFIVGDWILSQSRNFEGVVEDIGWYRTKVKNFDRRPMYVPNALLTDSIVENPGRMMHRRIKQVIGVRYQDMDCVVELLNRLRSLIKAHEGIDRTQPHHIHLVEYGAYSVNIELYCFVEATGLAEFRDLQEDVLLRIAKIIQELGADFAFPTQTLYLEQTRNESLSTHS